MDFDCSIVEIQQPDKDKYGEGLQITLIVPFYTMKKETPLEKRKEAQQQIDAYNINLTRLHYGYANVKQIIDSSENTVIEDKKT